MNVAGQPEVIPLWPNGASGTEDWNQQEQEHITPPPASFRTVRNVTRPTLMAFLPDPAVATGTAVIICPGGGFLSLAIEHEGIDVARWLSERGVAGCVLKYRLFPTEVRDEDYQRQMEAYFPDRRQMREVTKQIGPLAIADGQQAVKVVRQRASQWGIAPDRIGIMGFSAYSAWRAAGHPVELHIYAKGGHGFGMRKQGLPADHWIDRFGEWLQVQGFLYDTRPL